MTRRLETASMREALQVLAQQTAVQARIQFDPVEFPRRFDDPEDVEVVGLISASLAYGRAASFKQVIQALLAAMGSHPASFARAYSAAPDPDYFQSISYRFNRPRDFAAMVAGMGWMIATHGGLGLRFEQLFRQHGLRSALSHFGQELRTAPPISALLHGRGDRGLRYLFTDASGHGASKRWHLFLRWMVRGPDSVDLGVWRKFVPTSELIIPLDTHIARVARYLGFTTRGDLSWKTAAEITASLASIDRDDPVRFDFALCHHGMSGACPTELNRQRCAVCPIFSVCGRAGRRKPTVTAPRS